MRILLVEDEESISKILKMNLEMEDYEVVLAEDGEKAMDCIEKQHFDLLVLDVMLPKLNGYQICERVRNEDSETPILFLTAKDMEHERIMGLEKGADDYIGKPFNLKELLLRVKNLLRRIKPTEAVSIDEYRFGGNYVNFKTYEASNGTENFTLTKKEAQILNLLIKRKNEVISRKRILQIVWGYKVFPTTRTIDNFVLAFRKYFEKDPTEPKHFISVRGVGYKFIESPE